MGAPMVKVEKIIPEGNLLSLPIVSLGNALLGPGLAFPT
jgi:hypothetical protein